MRTTQGRTFQSLKAVQTFLDANAGALGAVATSGSRTRLDDVVTALDEQVAVQSGNTIVVQGDTRRHRALRLALLRDHMGPIAKIAAVELPNSPELASLRMPQGEPTAERLAAQAAGMAQAAEPNAAVFIAGGMPADFIAQLNSAATAMLQSVSDRRQTRSARVSATAGIKLLLSTGRRLVHALDALVKSALKDSPQLLAGWNTTKRVERLALQAPKPAPAPAPTPDPAPATAQG